MPRAIPMAQPNTKNRPLLRLADFESSTPDSIDSAGPNPTLIINVKGKEAVNRGVHVVVRELGLDGDHVWLTLFNPAEKPIFATLQVKGLSQGNYNVTENGGVLVSTNSENLTGGIPVQILSGYTKAAIDLPQLTACLKAAHAAASGEPDITQAIHDLERKIHNIKSVLDTGSLTIFHIIPQGTTVNADNPHLTASEAATDITSVKSEYYKLLQLAGGISNISNRESILSALFPVALDNVTGSALDILTRGQAGSGHLDLQLSHAFRSMTPEARVTLSLPAGWSSTQATATAKLDPDAVNAFGFDLKMPETEWGRLSIPATVELELEPTVSITELIKIPLRENAVRMWQVIGPFDNTGERGYERKFEPETAAFSLTAEYIGKSGSVRWKPMVSTADYLDLQALLNSEQGSVAYARTWVYSPSEQTIPFRIGCDGGFKLWVNGNIIGAANLHRAYLAGANQYDAPLHAGWNELLVKAAQSDGPWRFSTEIGGASSAAPVGLRVDNTPSGKS